MMQAYYEVRSRPMQSDESRSTERSTDRNPSFTQRKAQQLLSNFARRFGEVGSTVQQDFQDPATTMRRLWR